MRTRRIDLGGRWEYRRTGGRPQEWLPGRVPGCVQTDLLDAGLIPDPFVGTNEDKVQWVGQARWTYRRTFPAPALAPGARAYLVFEGLDTLATVSLNGRQVGASDNMFIPFRFEVTEALTAGENRLEVAFDSVPDRAAAAAAAYGVDLKNVGRIPNGPFIRKAPCHFGWDWGPAILTVGIWRPVRLEIVPRASIDAVDAWGDPDEKGGGALHLAVEAVGPLTDGLALEVVAAGPRGRTAVGRAEAALVAGRAAVAIPVRKAQLWWPNGLGRQPLYTLRARLLAGRKVVDEQTVRVGIRRLELVREPDEWGRSFAFRVNGQTLFAKGANWIPADAFPSRMTPERYRDLLASCAAIGMNMLRVWGGGYYEDPAFYDLCDELGLLVWQDFMYACAMYPGDDPAFAVNITREAAAAVRRLRRHTSLALWCGNNEMESGWFEWGWSKQHPERVWHGYERLFHDILPRTVAALDPRRAYIRSSPTSHEVGKPNDPSSGDAHVWNVWHGQGDHFNYLQSGHRFVSEFGYQSIPALETLGRVIPPDERRMDSPAMLNHQKSGNGNEKIVRAVEQWLGRPRDFESLIYLSQVYQALAIRTGVEHWRRSAPRTMGALYWQANDCWPVLSWASLDYDGRWKGLHYAARRFFAPYLVSGLADEKAARLWATADFGLAAARGEVRWQVRTWDGRVLGRGDRALALAGGKTAGPIEVPLEGLGGFSPQDAYVVAELVIGRKRVGRTVLPPVPAAKTALLDPQVQAKVRAAGPVCTRGGDPSAHAAGASGAVVEVKARNAALAVSLEAPGLAGRFEDNFFDLLPGERRSVRFWAAGRRGAGIGKALAKRLIVRTVYSAREIV